MQQPLPKRVFSWILGVTLGLYSLGFLFVGIWTLAFMSGTPRDRLISIIFICVGVFLLPVMSPILRGLGRRFGPKMDRPLLVLKTVVVVIRVLILAVATAFGVAIAPQAFPHLRELVRRNNPLPVGGDRVARFEQMVDEGQTGEAWDSVRTITNYRKRVDLARFAAADLRSARDSARVLADNGRTSDAQRLFTSALYRFQLSDMLDDIEAGKYKRSPLAKQIPPDELYGTLIDAAGLYTRSYSFEDAQKLLQAARAIAPDRPEPILLEADNLWYTGKLYEARALYGRYLDAMVKQGKRDSVTPEVVEIVMLEPKLSSKSLPMLYRWFLTGASSYLFDPAMTDREATVDVCGRTYGCYSGDINPMVHYTGGIPYYLKMFADTALPQDTPIVEPLARVSGERLEQPHRRGLGFSYVNPEIVAWTARTLLPRPEQDICGTTFQRIYDVVFRDFFRSYASIYVYLTTRTDIDAEKKRYAEATIDGNQYGPSYLQEIYGGLLVTNSVRAQHHVPWTVGFWLRRAIDSSIDACWDALSRGMRLYDRQWFESLPRRIDSEVTFTSSAHDEEYDEGDVVDGEMYIY